jgi:hypothetical protein
MIYQLIVVSREQSGSGHLWWHAGATHLGNRARHVGKGQILILFGLLIVLGGCSGYGGETVGASGTRSGRVQSDREYCAVTLPDGWTWRPASWAAVSPLGTEMAFADYLYGRPQYPEWEEAKSSAIEQVTRRTPDVEITEDDDTLRVDYGPDGGLAVLQRFDRVGCQLTFSRVAGARAQEIEAWEQIIASLERTSRDPHYTPSP